MNHHRHYHHHRRRYRYQGIPSRLLSLALKRDILGTCTSRLPKPMIKGCLLYTDQKMLRALFIVEHCFMIC